MPSITTTPRDSSYKCCRLLGTCWRGWLPLRPPYGNQVPGVSGGGGEGGLGWVVREGICQTPPQGPQPWPTAEQDTHDYDQCTCQEMNPHSQQCCDTWYTPLTIPSKMGDGSSLKGSVSQVHWGMTTLLKLSYNIYHVSCTPWTPCIKHISV